MAIHLKDHYSYTYDGNGNILSISDGNNATSYAYDTANQLGRENNQAAGKTTLWTYDNAGNILTRTEYAYTTAENPGTATATVNYTYGDDSWGDLLTAYDGVAITYDEIGNPLNDGTYSYTWEHGRQLKSLSDGTTTWTYTYDADGIRSSVSDGTTTNLYTYTGGQLTMMRHNGITMYFTYDATGRPQTMTYGTTTLYYLTNLQGDVIGLVNSSGQRVVSYTYDAWGNLLSTTGNAVQAEYNPLRYRGYVYDTETGLYYLQSRYYDPEIGRFLNADAFASTGHGILGNNMYSYCYNNPVIYADSEGTFPFLVIGIVVIAGAVGGALGAFSAATTGGDPVEGMIEGSLTGMIGAVASLFLEPVTAFKIATMAGVVIDIGVQHTSQVIASGEVTETDSTRVLKTGLQTGLGTIVPAMRNPAVSKSERLFRAITSGEEMFGTLLYWAEGSTLITVADVSATNLYEANRSMNTSPTYSTFGSHSYPIWNNFNARRPEMIIMSP